MKIAICFRGSHFDSYDYKNCINNQFEYLINPLLKDNEVDIFCIAYNNNIDNLINDYKPKKIHIINQYEQNNGDGWHRQLIFHKLIIQNIKDYEINNNIKYDIIINLRYDLFFTIKINEWDINLNNNLNKIIIAFRHLNCDDKCDDNFLIIPRTLLDVFGKAIDILYNTNQITHKLILYIDNDLLHFIYTLNKDDKQNKNEFRLFYIYRHKATSTNLK
jgi:hypothetical protein